MKLERSKREVGHQLVPTSRITAWPALRCQDINTTVGLKRLDTKLRPLEVQSGIMR